MPVEVPAIVKPAPLSPAEMGERARLEKTVNDSRKSFYAIGKALEDLFQKKLHRPLTWDTYCRDVLDMSPDQTERYRKQAEVVDVLKSANLRNFPANPHQAQQLVGRKPDDIIRCWKKAVETMPKGRQTPTAAHIAKVVEEVTGRPPGARPGEVSLERMMQLADKYAPPEEVHEAMTDSEEEAVESAAARAASVPSSTTGPWEKVESALSILTKTIGRLAKEDDDLRSAWEKVWASNAFKVAWAALEKKLRGTA